MSRTILVGLVFLAGTDAASAQLIWGLDFNDRPWGQLTFRPAVNPAPLGTGGSPSGNFMIPAYFPGWFVSEPPRARKSVEPAIRLPANDIIVAQLEGTGGDRAHLTIAVPQQNARLWVDGKLMTQTGLRRQFVTPPLAGDDVYSLSLRVEWEDATGPQRRTRTVNFSPGSKHTVTVR